MFSEQTEREVSMALGQVPYGSCAVLTPHAFQELLDAARRWDAARAGPSSSAAAVGCVSLGAGLVMRVIERPDGSVTLEP